MNLLKKRLREFVFGISYAETTFERRGFEGGDADARARIETIGRTFLDGYHAALAEDEPSGLAARLAAVEPELQGFAFEGAAMGLALLDYFAPWNRSRWSDFLEGAGQAHPYMVYVGAGWAMARLPKHYGKTFTRRSPLLGRLAIDGYGFHEGYFHWPKYASGQTSLRGFSGYSRRVFEQGLGRSLWFVKSADIELIGKAISAFPPASRSDLWSGVGLACAYAGVLCRERLEDLREVGIDHLPHIAQGVAFAVKTRLVAGNMAPHTELACRVLCGVAPEVAAAITDETLGGLPTHFPEAAYEGWRQRIQARFAAAEPEATSSAWRQTAPLIQSTTEVVR